MEAAEAGADYVALSQSGASVGGVPVVAWWSSMMEIPCVAFEPVEPHDLDILLPQNPDFIRPSDAMWVDAEAARRIVTDLRQRLEAK
jgi:thiamine-phosphate pyrophosphorylase